MGDGHSMIGMWESQHGNRARQFGLVYLPEPLCESSTSDI